MDLSTASRQDAHSNTWLGARVRVCISLPVLGLLGCWVLWAAQNSGVSLLDPLSAAPRVSLAGETVGRQGKEGNAAGCVCVPGAVWGAAS